jgi:PAS domain S-box-containing protein
MLIGGETMVEEIGASKKILLVEDEAIIALGEKRILERHGYNVTVAATGEKAVAAALAADASFDLILMDVDLGAGIDGPEAAAQILAQREIPIVFLSSHTDPEVVARTEIITSYGYNVKNSGETVLLASIKMAFRLYSAYAEARTYAEESHKFKTITDLSLQGRAIADLSGELLYVNSAFAQAHGYDVAELAGENLRLFHGTDQLPRVQELLDQLRREGSFGPTEVWHQHRDGSAFPMLMSGIVIPGENGQNKYIAASAIDNSEQLALRVKLAEERNLAQQYLDIAGVILVALDVHGRIVLINQKACEIFGRRREELLGENWFAQCVPPAIRTEVENVFRQVMEGKLDPVEHYENPLIDTNGNQRLISWHNAMLLDPHGKIIGTLSSGEDITRERAMMVALQEEEAILHATQRLGKVGGWEYDPATREILWTPETYRIHGMPHQQSENISSGFIAESLACYAPPDRTRIQAAFETCCQSGTSYQLDCDLINLQGQVLRIRTTGEAIREAGRIVKVRGHIMDITQQWQAEMALRQQLQEKELLLRDVHHRVKNNIWAIESLLFIQAEMAVSAEAKQLLEEAMNRTRNMRIIYDKLLHTEGFQKIELREYLEDLTRAVIDIFPQHEGIALATEIIDYTMDAKRAAVLGMIVNELLTNAMKYAFRGREKGQVSVSLTHKSGKLRLIVADDGVGLPEKFDIKKSGGLGCLLVKMQVDQLGGKLWRKTGPGTTWVVDFTSDAQPAD